MIIVDLFTGDRSKDTTYGCSSAVCDRNWIEIHWRLVWSIRLLKLISILWKVWYHMFDQVGVAALDLRSASLHLSQYIETSSSYQNTKTLLQFYDPMSIIVPPSKLAPDSMVGVSVLVDRYYSASKKVTASLAMPCFRYLLHNICVFIIVM